MKSKPSRREVLQTLLVGGALGITGCSGDGSDDTGSPTDDAANYVEDTPTPPEASFELEFVEIDEEGGAASVTVTHAGGESITAENTGQLVIWGDMLSETVFSSVGEDADSEPFEPGDTSTHTIDHNTATLYWSPPGTTTEEAESVVLTEASTDADL